MDVVGDNRDRGLREFSACVCCGAPRGSASVESRGWCRVCGLRWDVAVAPREDGDISNANDPVEWLRCRLAGAEEVVIGTANGDGFLQSVLRKFSRTDPSSDSSSAGRSSVRWTLSPRALLHAIERCGGWSADLAAAGWRSRLPRLRCRVRRGEGPAYKGGVSLVTLSCERDVPETIRMVLELAPAFAETVVLYDGDAVPAALEPLAGLSNKPNVKLFARPLEKDFAAQRNAATRLASYDWVLHLDADERPSPAMLSSLPQLVALGERHGFLTIGVPRATFVDGQVTETDPDPQYRLHHRSERWVRKVHERPRSFVQDWRRAWLVDYRPDVRMVHQIQSKFLAEKSQFYDAIREGAGDIDGLQQIKATYLDENENTSGPTDARADGDRA